jgi:energy-coupling factor transport system substrate-specific component
MDQDPTPLDRVALDLQELRGRAGDPSYAEIVSRIGQQRRAAGAPGDSRPGRTTVYDAFRTGRRRIDRGLVLEIVRALGADDAEVAAWDQRCRDAVRPPGDPTPATSPSQQLAPGDGARSLVLTLVCCLLANLLGHVLVDLLRLPLYLDMVGTLVAAVLLGPWWGAAVGAGTNVLGSFLVGPASLLFTPVNIVGALIWGYGVRHGWGRSAARFLALSATVGLACTLLAAPIVLLVFGGYVLRAEDAVTSTVLGYVDHLGLAVFVSNGITSLADKVITGFVGLAVLESLARADRPTVQTGSVAT